MRSTGLIVLAIAIGAWLTLVSGVRAEEPKIEFNLQAGDATVQLLRFADLTGREIMFAAGVVRGMRTNAVQGKFTVREAIDRLLAGTPLQMREDAKTGAFAIVTSDAGRAALIPDQPPPAASRESLSHELQPRKNTTMKTGKRKKFLSWIAAAFVASGSTAVSAQQANPGDPKPSVEANSDSADAVIALPEFNITETKGSDYRSRESISAARIRGALIDTPQSVSVLTREFLSDLSPTRLYDATRYVAGVTEGRGVGFSDRIIIRGFENDNRTVDNFFLSTTANFDESLVERVEVVKGPNAILSPTGTPGGSVNVITKSPQFKQAATLTSTIGLYDAQRMSLDVTGPVPGSEKLAYRLIGTVQNTDRAWAGTTLKQFIVSPQLSYRFTPRSTLTVKYFYADYATWGDPRVLIDSSVTNNANGSIAPGFSRESVNGANPSNHRSAYLNKIDAIFSTSFNDHISMRLAADYYYNRDVSDLTLLTFPGTGNRYQPSTGLYTPNYTWTVSGTTETSTFSQYFDPTNVTRSATLSYGWNQGSSLQNDYAANYKFSHFSSTSIVGWVALKTQSEGLTKTVSLPNFNLYNPVYTTPAYGNTWGTSSVGQTVQQQMYALQRFGFFDDRLYLTGGVSRVAIRTATTNRLLTTGAAVLDDKHNTTTFGALGKVTKGVSLYYSYSANASPTTFNFQPLWQEGRQHEFGVKTEFFNQRLSISAAHFQISQTNVVIANPEYQIDKTVPQQLLYALTNKGYEVEVTGNLTKEFSVVASSAWMHTRDKFDRRPRAIADRQAALLLNYKFEHTVLQGLSLYVGASYTGDSEGDAPPAATAFGVVCQPSFKVPAYTKCTAGGSYKWSNYALRLNIDNVLDNDYLYSPGARFAVAESSKRNVTLSLSIRL